MKPWILSLEWFDFPFQVNKMIFLYIRRMNLVNRERRYPKPPWLFQPRRKRFEFLNEALFLFLQSGDIREKCGLWFLCRCDEWGIFWFEFVDLETIWMGCGFLLQIKTIILNCLARCSSTHKRLLNYCQRLNLMMDEITDPTVADLLAWWP